MSLPCDVVIVNYNAGGLLVDCVMSVLAQDVHQVTIVDNASGDNSLALVELSCGDEGRLKIVRNARNLGFAAGCNIGNAACSQPFVLFINPDATLEGGALQGMLDVLASTADAGMAGGLICNFDGSEQPGGRRDFPTPMSALIRVLRLHRLASFSPRLFSDFLLHRESLKAEPMQVEAISGACMLIRREAMLQVGGWDEGYFLHCEDLDLCMRFHQKNWKIYLVPDVKIFHVWRGCSRSRPIFVEWHKHRGMIRFYDKFFRSRYPQALAFAISIGVWLRFTVVAAGYSVHHVINFVRRK